MKLSNSKLLAAFSFFCNLTSCQKLSNIKNGSLLKDPSIQYDSAQSIIILFLSLPRRFRDAVSSARFKPAHFFQLLTD